MEQTLGNEDDVSLDRIYPREQGFLSVSTIDGIGGSYTPPGWILLDRGGEGTGSCHERPSDFGSYKLVLGSRWTRSSEHVG